MIVRPGTLDIVHQLPQRRLVNVGARPLKATHTQINSFLDHCGLSNPGTEAVEFYTLNHLVSLLSQRFSRYEALPDFGIDIVHKYADTVSNQVLRFAIYLMMICMRESRHDGSHSQKHIDALRDEFGLDSFNFIHNKIGRIVTGGFSPTQAIQAFRGYHFKDATLGQFFGMVVRVFERGDFSSSYGGYRWVTCAKPLLDWIEGRISGEALVDIGYTLAHNGGPIFNKGMTYSQTPGAFRSLLDIQRAGYLPEAILAGGVASSVFEYDMSEWAGTPLAGLVKRMKEAFPDSIKDAPDGYAISAISQELKDKIKAIEIAEKVEISLKKQDFLYGPAETKIVDSDFIVLDKYGNPTNPNFVPKPFAAAPAGQLPVPDDGLLTGFYDVLPGAIASVYTRPAKADVAATITTAGPGVTVTLTEDPITGAQMWVATEANATAEKSPLTEFLENI